MADRIKIDIATKKRAEFFDRMVYMAQRDMPPEDEWDDDDREFHNFLKQMEAIVKRHNSQKKEA